MKEKLVITFDSNVWRLAGDPLKFPKDPMHSAFVKINSALGSGKIEGRLSETVFTLEGITRSDRKKLLGSYKPKINIAEEVMPDGLSRIRLSIDSDPSVHPGNNQYLSSHLKDALTLGFKLMRCPRIAGIVNPAVKDEWYVQSTTSTTVRENTFSGVGRKIEEAGAGIANIKAIGCLYKTGTEHWPQGLANAPATQDKAIASAVAEWADGDTVSAHVTYGNHYICTRDSAKAAGQNSVFSLSNRVWLEKVYGVKFILPEELAKLVR